METSTLTEGAGLGIRLLGNLYSRKKRKESHTQARNYITDGNDAAIEQQEIYSETGRSALSRFADRSPLASTFLSDIKESDEFQFQLEESEDALENNLSSRGIFNSSSALSEISKNVSRNINQYAGQISQRLNAERQINNSELLNLINIGKSSDNLISQIHGNEGQQLANLILGLDTDLAQYDQNTANILGDATGLGQESQEERFLRNYNDNRYGVDK